MIIEERFGNYLYGNLIIQNYPNLQSIVVKKYSLHNLNSLKICNCEQLKTIEIEGGNYDAPFRNVKSVVIERNCLFMFCIISIFPNYNHSKQEINHSLKQQVYLYQVILSNSTLVYIFLIYNHSKQDINHSKRQQVYLYQVILSNSTLVYIFLIYDHSKQEKNHSFVVSTYHYLVILSHINSIFLSS